MNIFNRCKKYEAYYKERMSGKTFEQIAKDHNTSLGSVRYGVQAYRDYTSTSSKNRKITDEQVMAALRSSNVTKAARDLCVSRQAIYARRKKIVQCLQTPSK